MNPSSCSIIFKALALAALLTAFTAHAESFTLNDKQGRSIKADVIEVTGDQVKIKRDDGQTFNVSLSTLAADDQTKLKAWAEKESKKSLPPGALQVELSRGNFKTIKVDSDVTLVGGEIVKNGRTTTEEKWGYAVTIINKTSKPIDNLRTEYRLFATVDNVHVKEKEGLKKKAYQSQIENIPELGRTVFRTETISALKMKYNGNIVSAKTGDSNSRETLTGIWMRIYLGDELVYEAAMPEKLRTTEKW
ncbi:hypothetical protein [Rariglobus hedericola]|uniref:SLA1 homology domain-containing protein n=1 Tax=Rariglobus hedericola TaxID=2597822 RepID=A0A556QRL9_9BACT|nr:hypothetical protein [Rariglobus hedericola]TSJ79272.1 hypothetical protein FPL22_08260 [Rariglobus hedericola]